LWGRQQTCHISIGYTGAQQLSDKAARQVKYKKRIQWRNENLPVRSNGARMDADSALRTIVPKIYADL